MRDHAHDCNPERRAVSALADPVRTADDVKVCLPQR